MFVDLWEKKQVASMGGNKYPMIGRDAFARHAWMYIVSHKYGAASVFEKLLADLRVEGPPSEVSCGSEIGRWRRILGRKNRKALSRKIKKTRIRTCRQPRVQRSN